MLKRMARRLIEVWQVWGPATVLGVATALLIWSVWYFTKLPCLPDNAAQGLCNPGILARFINAEILTLAGGSGIAVGALKGGYDNYMLRNMVNQEREARLQSEQQLRELIDDLRNELQEEREHSREERERAAEERERARAEQRLAAEERAQSMAIQQAMLDTIVRLAEERNGNGNHPRA